MTRHAHVIALRPEQVEEYKRLHRAVWPEVRAQISACGMRNFSVYLKTIGGTVYLFSYYEYVGADYAADMARRAEDAKTREWWALMAKCQVPIEERGEGEWWAGMEEVFHME